MTATAFNRICAHPIAICWIIGACVLDVLLLTWPDNGAQLAITSSGWRGGVYLLFALVPTTGLGYFVGMFTCWPWMRPLCSRFNGAPLKVGDRIEILSGPHRGTTTSVYEVATGQGGWEYARVDLGPERRAKFADIFEEYSVLKVAMESGGQRAV